MESALVPHTFSCPVSGVVTTATVATGSAAVDRAAAETGDDPASAPPKEVLLGQETVEEGAQTEEGTGTRAGEY